MAGGPDFFKRADKKGKDKGSHDNTEAGSPKIIKKSHLGQAHAEIHRGKGKVNQA